MKQALKRIDPITFEIQNLGDIDFDAARRALLKNIKENMVAKDEIERLKWLNDHAVDLFLKGKDQTIWMNYPADTRFPGFFSNLGDHALGVSTIGIALAIEAYRSKVNFASDYEGRPLGELLKSEQGLIQVVRFLSLFHDIGKPPFQNHDIRTHEVLKEFLERVGLLDYAEDLSKTAARHHYGSHYDPRRQPNTLLEWVIALADKVAVMDRVIPIKIEDEKAILQAFEWLQEQLPENDETMDKYLKYLKTGELSDELNMLLPLNLKKTIQLNNKLLRVDDLLQIKNGQIKIALMICEGKSIQEFIRKSEARRYLTGASSLIASVFNLFAQIITDKLARESVIYSSSGSILAIIPFTMISEINQQLFMKYKEKIPRGLGIKLPSKEIGFNLFQLKTGPPYAWHLTSKLAHLNRNFGELFTIEALTLIPYFEKSLPKILPHSKICSICFSDEAFESDEVEKFKQNLPEDEKDNKFCKRCYYIYKHDYEIRKQKTIQFSIQNSKYIIDERGLKDRAIPDDELIQHSPIMEATEKISQKLREYIENDLEFVQKLEGLFINYQYVLTLNCLGRQSREKWSRKDQLPLTSTCDENYDIAYICGDGDNFGLLKSKMPNITMYRHISYLFRRIMEGSLFNSLAKLLKWQLRKALSSESSEDIKTITLEMPFQIIYYSGDDFLIILDAGFLLKFLQYFRDEVQKILGIHKTEYDKITQDPLSIFSLGVSLGVIVTSNRMPIYSVLEALGPLEKKAKEKSKNQEMPFGSEITIAFQKFTSIPNIEAVDYRYNNRNNLKLTSFPLSGEEFRKILSILKELVDQYKLTPNKIANLIKISSSLFKKEKKKSFQEEEIKLKLGYRAARLVGEDGVKTPEVKGYLKLLKEFLSMTNEGIQELRHLDFIELLKCLPTKNGLPNTTYLGDDI